MPPAARLLALFMLFGLSAWSVVAWVHIVPALDRRSKRDALLIAVLLHMFRTIGAMAMFPGLAAVPVKWALPLAWGDGITAVLAMLSTVALKMSWAHATKLVWVFNVFGLLDMLHNAYNCVRLQVAPHMGPDRLCRWVRRPGHARLPRPRVPDAPAPRGCNRSDLSEPGGCTTRP